MSDLLTRLKSYRIEHVTEETKLGILEDIKEAADEIERLRRTIDFLDAAAPDL